MTARIYTSDKTNLLVYENDAVPVATTRALEEKYGLTNRAKLMGTYTSTIGEVAKSKNEKPSTSVLNSKSRALIAGKQ